MFKQKKEPKTILDCPEPILWHLLSTKRPHGSQGIQECMTHIEALAPRGAVIHRDTWDNLWIDCRGKTESKTMFAAHLDTVEARGQEGLNTLLWYHSGWVDTAAKAILGADDGAGCAMLVSLMMGGTPALYLFTQGEECGGLAAKEAAKDTVKLTGIDRCIAFDRKGNRDIVADQARGVLASRAFVTDLATKLGMGHTWSTGSYTDSSEFSGTIKEIVNISIGYTANHCVNERLDYLYFKSLRAACLKMDWESLPTVGPDPEANKCRKYGRGGYGHYGGYGEDWSGWEDWEDWKRDNVYTSRGSKGHQPALPLITLDKCPWIGEARTLADSLGFDPDVDEALTAKLSQSLKDMYDLGGIHARQDIYKVRGTAKIIN